LVLAYHLQPAILRVGGKIVSNIAGLGWAGVDLFFVLSGFLITSILLSTRDQPRYFLNFYGRRFLRIFPLYYIYLAFIIFLVLPIVHKHGLLAGTSDAGQAWYWFYLSNWFTSVRDGIPLLGHLWSLSIEEQFYIAWPVVVFLLSSKQLRILCWTIIGALLVLRFAFAGQFANPEIIHRLTVFRIDALCWGALIAVSKQSSPRSKASWQFLSSTLFFGGMAAVVALVALQGPSYTTWWGTAVGFSIVLLPSAGIVLYAASCTGETNPGARALRLAPLRQLGKYSYGIYVLHVLIIATTGEVVDRLNRVFGLSERVSSAVFILTAIAASYLAALLSWHAVEKYFLRLKRHLDYRPDVKNAATVQGSHVGLPVMQLLDSSATHHEG
jgi:peptidoglycan/LPS O-acetylase OafA/YrhL